MAKEVLKNATVLLGAYDLSPDTNQIAIPLEVDPKDVTNFASGGWREFLGGLKTGPWTFSGFDDQPTTDAPNWSALGGTSTTPVTVTRTNPIAAGDLSFTGRCIGVGYSKTDPVGEPAAFSSTLNTSGAALRGVCLNAADAATAAGNGAGQDRGAVSATQRVYAVLHVLSVTGTTPVMPLKVESDADDTWASALDRLTFTNVTDDPTTHVQVVELAGPVTDTWWRAVRGTITGAGATFKYRVFLIIQ